MAPTPTQRDGPRGHAPRRRRRLRRWLTIVAAALALCLLSAVVLLYTAPARSFVERRIEGALTRALGSDVRLELAELSPLALRARIVDLRIAADEGAGSPPFLAIDEIAVDGRWRGLLAGRVDLERLTVSGLRLDLRRLPSPPERDAPEESPAAAPELAELMRLVRVDRLAIERARIVGGSTGETPPRITLEADGLRLDVHRIGDAPRYRLELAAGRGMLLVDDVRSSFSMEASGEARPAGIELRSDLASPSVRAGGTALRDLRAGIEVDVDGESLAAPAGWRGTFDLGASGVDLPWTRSTVDVDLGLAGSFDGPRLRLERLDAIAPGLVLRGSGASTPEAGLDLRLTVRTEDTAAAGRWIGQSLAVDDASPALRSASGTLDAELEIVGPPLLGVAEPSGPPPTGHRATLVIDGRGLSLAGPAGAPLDLQAAGTLTATGTGGVELSGVTLRAALPHAELEAGGSADLATGTIDASTRLQVDWTDAGLRRWRRELRAWGVSSAEGGPWPVLERLRGSLSLDGEVTGAWNALDGRLGFRGRELGPVGTDRRRSLDGELALHAGRLDARATLAGDGGGVEASWRAPRLGVAGELVLEIEEERLDWWAAAGGVELAPAGRVDARVVVDLDRGALEGRVELAGASYAGVPFSLSVPGFVAGADRVRVEGAELRVAQGTVRIDGEIVAGSSSSLELSGRGIELGELADALSAPVEAAATLAFDATVTGRPLDPRVDATVELSDTRLAGRPLGGLHGTLTHDAGGSVLRWREDAAQRARLKVDPAAPWGWALDVDLPVTWATGDAAAGLAVGVDGRLVAALTGTAAEIGSIAGRVALDDAAVRWGEQRLRGDALELTVEAGRIRLDRLRLSGDGDAFVEVSGDAALAADGPLELRLAGTLPLTPLGAVAGTPVTGQVAVDLRLAGTTTAPSWQGDARLRDVALAVPGSTLSVRELSANVELGGPTWRIRDVAARVGRGEPITGHGSIVPLGDRAGALELELTFDDQWLPLGPDQQLQIDAALRLRSEPGAKASLDGDVEIIEGIYLEEIDPQSRLLARGRAFATGPELGGALDRVDLDLRVTTSGAVYVRNELASLEGTARLDVAGTAADPRLSGEVQLEQGGRITFRDVTYSLERGRLFYVSDPPGDPRLELSAATAVDEYAVELIVAGRLSDPRVELVSQPPLPEADIIALLLTGRTRDSLGSGGGGGLSEAQAALYLTGDLSKRIGDSLAGSLGFDEVRIDPVLVGNDVDPTTRLTLGRSLTADLDFTYSRALSGSQDDIYRLRYRPLPHWELIARNDENDELLADARYTHRLHVGPGGPRVDEVVREPRIVELRFEGTQGIGRRALRRELGLRERRRMSRARLLSGTQAIRERYVAEGYPDARVDASTRPVDDGVELLVAIDAGRRLELDVEADDGDVRRVVRRAVLDGWPQTRAAHDLAASAASIAEAGLADRGWTHASVDARLAAETEHGSRLELHVTPGPRVRVERIEVSGNRALADPRILDQMLTRPATLLRRGRLRAERLEADREAVRAMYRALGYLRATVDTEIRHPDRPGRAVVEVQLDEGPRFTVDEVRIDGNDAFDDERLREPLDLQAGSVYDDARVREARRALRRFYDERGYPDVRVGVEVEPGDEADVVDVGLTVEEGPRLEIRSIELDAEGTTRPALIRRQLTVAEGQPLSADRLADSRQNLYRTGLFRGVAIERRPVDGRPGEADLRVHLTESPNMRVSYGLGYSTDESWRVAAEVGHINLFGRGLYGAAAARVGDERSRASATLRQRALLGSPFEGLVSAAWEEERREALDVTSLELTTQVDRRFELRGRPLNAFVGYGISDSDIAGLPPETFPTLPPDVVEVIDPRRDSTLRLARLFAGFVRDRRDDPVWPTAGSVLQAEVEWFDESMLSQAELVGTFVQWSRYGSIGPQTVWSVGGRAGLARAYGDTRLVPLSERLLAGGEDTVRGFSRDAIRPVGFPAEELGEEAAPLEGSLGGESLLLLNVELARRMIEPLWAVAFVDAGNVYWRPSDFDPGRLRSSAGVGIRARTPVGPLRVEYGWKLDRRADESRGALHIAIGVPF